MIVGKKKLGISLVKWMNADKDVYGRKGREGCVGYLLFICCSKHIIPNNPLPDLGL